MAIALTDDHRELASVAGDFLTTHKARAAARELLDAPGEGRPGFWADLAGLGRAARWVGSKVRFAACASRPGSCSRTSTCSLIAPPWKT